MRRLALLLTATLCSLALLAGAATSAPAQDPGAPGGAIEVDPGSRLIVVTPPPTYPMEMIVGYNASQVPFIYFVVVNGRLVPGPGCQFLDPMLQALAVCPPPPQIVGLDFEPGNQKIDLRINLPFIELPPNPPLEPLPESLPIGVGGSPKGDRIDGSPNTEKVDTGKGKDNVNPGPGNDKANLGPGNDTANTKDGERDVLNGGKGKDAATVDKKDKVKNVEKVKRK